MLIKFCQTCNNDMYIKWNEEDIDGDSQKYMVLFCKKCGDVLKKTREDFNQIDLKGEIDTRPEANYDRNNFSPIIYKKNYENKKIDSRLFNNEFITHDRTLPFVEDPNIKCPSCVDPVKQEILYQIYDNDNMKFLYTCKNCSTSWTIS